MVTVDSGIGLPTVNVLESTLEWTYGEVRVNSGIGFHTPCFSLDSASVRNCVPNCQLMDKEASGNFKKLSQDRGGGGASKNSLKIHTPFPFIKIFLMRPLSARSISMDNTFIKYYTRLQFV